MADDACIITIDKDSVDNKITIQLFGKRGSVIRLSPNMAVNIANTILREVKELKL